MIAEAIPDGDVLPVRASYTPTGLDADAQGRPTVQHWSIGVNPLSADRALAFALPHLIASTLHTGRPPKVTRAVRFVAAGGRQPTLAPVQLRGQIAVDPRSEDFFHRVVEARQEVKHRVRGHAGRPRACPLIRGGSVWQKR